MLLAIRMPRGTAWRLEGFKMLAQGFQQRCLVFRAVGTEDSDHHCLGFGKDLARQSLAIATRILLRQLREKLQQVICRAVNRQISGARHAKLLRPKHPDREAVGELVKG